MESTSRMRVESILADPPRGRPPHDTDGLAFVASYRTGLLAPYLCSGRRLYDLVPAFDVLSGITVVLALVLGVHHDRLQAFLALAVQQLVQFHRGYLVYRINRGYSVYYITNQAGHSGLAV